MRESGDQVADVQLRPLRRSDLPLLGRWLAEPLVRRWWDHDTSPEAVERDFGPSIDGVDETAMRVATTAEGPYGLVQRYPIAAYAEYLAEFAPVCPVLPGALSVDYLVGEPAARGRGLGAAMIRAAVEDGWAAHPGAPEVLVPVCVGNRSSWRALERAGFTRFASGEMEPDNPVDPRDHHVYRLVRPA